MNSESSIEKRLRSIETAFATYRAGIQAMGESVVDHEARLREIEELVPLLKVNLYILMGLGGSVISLIWALITGQVTIVFQ